MRALLVNANRFKQPWPVIPFGLCCVAAAAEAAGHDVEVLDLCFSRHAAQEIRAAASRVRPEVVGVSIRNIDNSAGWNTLFLLGDTKASVIDPLKSVFSGPIVIGGPSVGINGAEMLDFFDLRYAIRGDGEASFLEFLRRLAAGEALDGLGGLVRRERGAVVEDNEPLRVEDLDSLPLPNPARYLDLQPYRRFDSPLQVQTKRGCALGCTYCTYNRIEGERYRLRSPSRVADQIERLVRETGIDHVELTDSTFNVPLDHAKAVLRAVIAKGLKLRLRTMGLNPGAVDEELADLIRDAGFRDVDLGAESGSDITLSSLGKSFRKNDVLRAGKLLRDRRVPTTWYLLLGAPGETEETLRETFETMDQAAGPWDLVNIGVGVRVYKGSPMATGVASRDGLLTPVAADPGGLSLKAVKAITKRAALCRNNYFMYDEDEKTPALVLMLGASALRLLAPRQPLWRLFIWIRIFQRLTGVNWLRARWFERGLAGGRATAGESA